MLRVTGPETVSMTTRDGVRLDADLYRPAEGGPYPVLLMRQPYGRRIASTVVFAHPRWYAAQGYIVVIQDVRGTGSSEGTFRAFEAEREDGADSVAWAAALPGSTGRVGMYGFSYQGMTQLLALAGGASAPALPAPPLPILGALAPVMVGWDLHGDWAYEGGALRLADGIGWGIQMAAIRAGYEKDDEAFRALSRAARALPLQDETPAYPDVLRRYRKYGHFTDWVENEAPDATYWARTSPRAALAGQRMDVPMLHIGGWYDTMLMGTLDAFDAARAASDQPQRLVVGPWPHLPWGRMSGGDMGPQADAQIDRMQLRWFDGFLKDSGGGGSLCTGLELFDVGARVWREFTVWPAETRALYLASGGLAAPTVTDGVLQETIGNASADQVVHDPWRPVPSFGGHDAAPMGRQDRTALDARADIACFTSASVTEDALIVGRVGLDLWVEADAASFDISAVLSEVTPEGRAIILTQGYRRVVPGEALPVRISLRAICATIAAGSALRLSLAGASFPAHPVNPGTGAPLSETRATDCQVITLSLGSGGETPSRLILPWITATPSPTRSHTP
jgi:putative CocE/NonD family hydrolase